MNFQAICERWNARDTEISSTVMAIRSFVRGLPSFLAARPKTPLRVLCLMAFDTLYRLRRAVPLPRTKLSTMAAFLDFAASMNANFDNKECGRRELRLTQQQLAEAGIGSALDEYLHQLRDLESSRPGPGDDRRFQHVVAYREAVVRLSLGMLATIADLHQSLDAGIHATHVECDLQILFRMAMQCQIIDDVLDYSTDLAADLPSFLTASRSLTQSFELTQSAALAYADDDDLQGIGLLPLRTALSFVSICTKQVISIARWQRRVQPSST